MDRIDQDMPILDPLEGPAFFSRQVSEARRFYLDLAPSPRERLAVVSGGRERCAEDYEIRRRGFPYRSIELVIGGKGSLTLGGRKHALEPGTVFTYGPGIPQRILTDPRERLVKYFADFSGREAGRLLGRNGLRPGTVVRTSVPHEVADLFEDLLRNGLRGTRWSAAICASLVEHIILKVSETSRPSGTRETMARATYERCRRVLEEGFLGFRTQGDVARACRVDPAYLCRLFRRFGHQSPYRLLLRLKMAHAALLLEAPGALVKEVAGELGFADPYHFSRAFKRVFGASPRRLAELGHRG